MFQAPLRAKRTALGDRCGRTAAQVVLPDGRVLNHEHVKAGLAWWYRRYVPGGKRLQLATMTEVWFAIHLAADWSH